MRFLVVDDHSLVRAGARAMLEASFPAAIVEEAGSIGDALRTDRQPPSVILLDVRLQGISGLEGIALFRDRWPDTPVVMLAAEPAPDMVRAALDRGARAFVSKADSPAHILDAIARATGTATDTPAVAPDSGLTPRQLEVLDKLCLGQPNKLIASSLFISEFTVRAHVRAIFAVLGVSSRTEAIVVARCRGIVQ